MSKHPTERVRSVAEMQATSLQQADKALRRMAAAEERLARLEGRLAERDELIAEFREAYGRQADTLNAMGAVVKELESKIARGVDQVLTGLEGRITELERENANGYNELRELIALNEKGVPSLAAHAQLEHRVAGLEAKPKRGRPKGSKNKPKDTPPVEVVAREIAQEDGIGGDSSNPKASEAENG